ncbi:MAG: discoidin domain-containing protein [Saccharofermentanales bacterium]
MNNRIPATGTVPGDGRLQDVNWFLKAKYGLYVTYQHNDADWVTQQRYTYTCRPDGTLSENVDEIADAFDAESFAQDCIDMGVQYVTFTAYHGHMHVLYPSRFIERNLPGHTSSRDLIRDLIDALHARGLRLQLYIHASIGDTMMPADRARTGYDDPDRHFGRWNDFINTFFDELAARYGEDIDSYYIDMISDPEYLERVDGKRIRDTLLRYSPYTPIVGNGNAEAAVDYGSKEDGAFDVPDIDFRVTYAAQSVVCQSRSWWANVPSTGGNAAKYTPEHLFRYLVMTAGANAAGGGLAVGATPYVGGGWEPGVKESLVALGGLIRPIAESILDTLPGTSYVTPGGVPLRKLPYGIATTQSADGRYTYLHVLTPPGDPERRILRLPAPSDGKIFSSAMMLRSGQPAILVQNPTGLLVTIPEPWHPLDTVIRLTTALTPDMPDHTTLLPQNGLRIAACSGSAVGHEPEMAIDGNPDTFWLTDNAASGQQGPITCWTEPVPAGWRAGTRQFIVIDLGRVYPDFNQLRYLPRQDGTTGIFRNTDFNLYNIYISVDGERFTPVKTGQWRSTGEEKCAVFAPIKARFVKLEACPGWNFMYGDTCYAAAEIRIGVLSDSKI